MTEQTQVPLKDIIVKLKRWAGYIFSKKIILILSMVAGAGIGLLYTFLKKPEYTGTLTFVLYSESKLSGMSALASQFGLDINMGSSGAFDGDNITGLLNSERIIIPVILKVPKDGKTTLLNTFIEREGLLKKWKKKSRLKDYLPFPEQKSAFKLVQDSLLQEVCEYLVKNNLLVDKIDKKLNYYRLRVKTHDPILSVNLANYIVSEASDFYIQTKTKLARQNLVMITHEADSLSTLLRGILVNNAQNTEVNLNPAFQVARAPLQQGQLRLNAVGIAYGEVIKNLELAKITLQKETPLYQVIDAPLLPLKKQQPSILAGILTGAFVAGFATFILLLLNIIYRDTMGI
ncbi:MAG: hypothetical protein ABIQ31_07765 [Ferruginibacter sp.]